ncbi:MAG TPA: hypothetical protein ENN87_07860 [Phycisphaerales bacterium]|nr:hypothetical protein [Phycisphaerales bacterium]
MDKDDRDRHEPKDERREMGELREGALRWLGVGIEFCVVVVLSMLFGHWLDTKADTSPGFLILFFLFGFGGMLYSMIKRAGGMKWK